MSVWRGCGGTGRFPHTRQEEGGLTWGKHGFPHGSEPQASDVHAWDVTAYVMIFLAPPTRTVRRSLRGTPRELAGQMMKSRKVPLNGQFVMFFVLLPNCTGYEPPIGSTICAVSLAATGFPPCVARTT